MEEHKPKAAHSSREFLIEIGTIICGILIALGLEQALEPPTGVTKSNAIYAGGRDGNPFDPQAWQASAWDTAQTGDVVSHLNQDRSEQCARIFRFVTTERELQWKLQDECADVVSARFGSDAASRPVLRASLERYRQTGHKAYEIANAYLDAAAELGARPTAEAIQGSKKSATECMRRIRAAYALGAETLH